jgi:ubiquinone/menaquinone biosynthesis C-methylase UbiE
MTDETDRVLREYAARDADQRLAGRYRLTNPSHLFQIQQRERAILALLVRHGLADRLGHARVLDVGCGTGGLLVDMLRYGVRPDYLAGIDLVPERLATARERLPAADLRRGSADCLPYADATFDLVCQMTVLSTVLDQEMRQRIAAEMVRVLRPDGLIVWYDLRWQNPRNPGVRGIGAREVAALFPGCTHARRSITMAAPLARVIVPRARLLAEALDYLPVLHTHLLAGIRPVGGASPVRGAT